MFCYVVVINGQVQDEVYRTIEAAAGAVSKAESTLRRHFKQSDSYQFKDVLVKRCKLIKGLQKGQSSGFQPKNR